MAKAVALQYIGGPPEIPIGPVVVKRTGDLIQICWPKGLFKWGSIDIPPSDIIAVALNKDLKESRSLGKALAGAAIGGILTGGVGALVGAAVGGRSKTKDQSTIVMRARYKGSEMDFLFSDKHPSLAISSLTSLLR